MEAVEEAGVIGRVAEHPIGYFRYGKRLAKGYEVPVSVGVYPMLVQRHKLKWRERKQRQLRWVGYEDALKALDDVGLRRLMKKVSKRDFEVLRNLLD